MALVPPRQPYVVPVQLPDKSKPYISVGARTKLGAQLKYWTTDWADPEDGKQGVKQIGLPFPASELGKVP